MSQQCLQDYVELKQQVLFISQDDKATVPIKEMAAKLQVPILMHLGYK